MTSGHPQVIISVERLALGLMATIILNFAVVVGLVALVFVVAGVIYAATHASNFAGFLIIGSISILAVVGAITISLWGAKSFLDCRKRAMVLFSILLFGWYLIMIFGFKTPDYGAIGVSILALGTILIRRRHLPA
jgi:hypothetical protein